MASFSCACCSGDRSLMVTSIMSPISGILIQLDGSHRACQKVCWRKIGTSRQAHSKPKGAGLTHVMNPESVPVNLSWNWQRMKIVR
jgi:hypothetical protein